MLTAGKTSIGRGKAFGNDRIAVWGGRFEMRWDDFRRSDNVEDDRDGGGGGFRRRRLSFSGRWRRPRHRYRGGARPDRLGDRHRSEHSHRWRRNGQRAARNISSRISSRRGAPARRRTRRAISLPLCSAIPKMSGPRFSRPAASTYRAPRLRLYRGASRAAAASRRRRWGRSIVRPTSASISTRRSSATCTCGSTVAAARRANSPRPM